MALGSTHSLTEMSTRNLPEDKGRWAIKSVNLIDICGPIFWKMWEPRRLTTYGLSRPVTGIVLLFLYIYDLH
jgi:hypothetical protein